MFVLAMSGAAISAHRLNSLVYSPKLLPPFPIWRRSGSFHAPGPASRYRPTVPSKLPSIDPKLSSMSVVVRHRFEIGAPHSHGSSPGSGLHIEKTMLWPVALSALLMRV